jgi:hypothetical protein
MNYYEIASFILIVIACVTCVTAFIKGLDQYVADYAHDTRKGL